MRIDGSPGGLPPRRGLDQVSHDLGASRSKLASAQASARDALDPADQPLSSGLEGTIRSLESASRGITDGINLAQGAAQHLADASSLIERMRGLALRSDNGGVPEENGASLQVELEGPRSEAKEAPGAEGPGKRSFFKESSESLSDQGGTNDGERADIELMETGHGPGLTQSDSPLDTEPSSTLDKLTHVQEGLDAIQNELRASEQRLSSTLKGADDHRLGLLRTNQQNFDADIALEEAELARRQLLRRGSASVRLQSNVAALRAQSLLGGLA